MDEKFREQKQEDQTREATTSHGSDERNDFERRRTQYERPPLTKREQQERWQIG
jgi:hypothetical protein